MPRVAPLIFVSSTTQDLADYRRAIQLGLPAMDVLYRGMEFFGARPNRPRDAIIEELIECEMYLGVLAHRYGDRDDSGVSYTELEYQVAKSNGIPRYVFIIDDSEPILKTNIDTDLDSQARLEEFKKSVRKDSVVDTFSTPEDLITKIGESIRRFVHENSSRLQARLHFPVDSWDNNYIRALYSAEEHQVIHALSHLAKVECRAAFEHVYGLLNGVNLSSDLADKLLGHLILSEDDERTAQMLLNLFTDRPLLRPRVIHAVGQRALLTHRSITNAEVSLILSLAGDPSDSIRCEVAHALGKLLTKRKDKKAEIRVCLEGLCNDSAKDVQAKASWALHNAGAPPPRTFSAGAD